MNTETATLAEVTSALAKAEAAEDITVLRAMADELELPYSGNTGVPTLKGKVVNALTSLKDAKAEDEATETTTTPVEATVPNIPTTPIPEPEKAPTFVSEDEEDEVIDVAPKAPVGPSVEELLEMDASQEEDPKLRRLILRAQALKLVRVRITNLDPGDAEIPGRIVTVYSKYTGKVTKLIPFGEATEGGYHIPQILYDHLKEQKFAMRREVRGPGSAFGVKKRKTTWVKKYALEVLPPLTKEEVRAMAQRQTASQAIDKPE